LTKNDELVEQLKADYTTAALDPAERAMLDYAAKLTLAPSTITEADIEQLRGVGVEDRAILDLAMIVAYFAYVNRIADGLGVTLEAYWEKGEGPGA